MKTLICTALLLIGMAKAKASIGLEFTCEGNGAGYYQLKMLELKDSRFNRVSIIGCGYMCLGVGRDVLKNPIQEFDGQGSTFLYEGEGIRLQYFVPNDSSRDVRAHLTSKGLVSDEELDLTCVKDK